MRSGCGDEVFVAVEQFDRALVGAGRAGQLAETMEYEGPLHLDSPGISRGELGRTVQQVERSGRVAHVEHDHRKGAADVAKWRSVDSSATFDAVLQIGARPDEVVQLTTR